MSLFVLIIRENGDDYKLVEDFGPFEGRMEGDNLTTMLICRLPLLEHKSPTLKRFPRCDALSQ